MSELRDIEARRRALTDLDATLVVEAAAGTGKTSLLSGRVAMLLAQGADPSEIAAITFTELAASELGARITEYMDRLLVDDVPECLELVIPPRGLPEPLKGNLRAASARRDQLSVTTIHAFCENIISSYAVEANIDPGARMLDADHGRAAFDDVFDRWLKRRFAMTPRAEDPLTALSRVEPQQVVKRLRDHARFRQKHRTARVPPADLSGRPDRDFVEAVTDFRRWLNSLRRSERNTGKLVDDLEKLSLHFGNRLKTEPDFSELWRLAHPRILDCMGWQQGNERQVSLQTPTNKGGWETVAGKIDGPRLNDEALHHFRRVDHCYRTLMGKLSGAITARLSGELDQMLDEYRDHKRDAALLDFDDLLHRARGLLRQHDQVRNALAQRYRYILVDEYQDTDPIQSEILFRLGSDEPLTPWENSKLRPGALFFVGDPKQSVYRFRGADVGCYLRARDAIGRQWPRNILQVTENFRSRPAILSYVNDCFEVPFQRDGQPRYVALTETRPDPTHSMPCVAKLAIDSGTGVERIRTAEAAAVAELCARLIGNFPIGPHGETIKAGDIALLAPVGLELGIYEQALEEKGLPIASQAGKGLFRRQEVQDMLSLARALADRADTLAFGALMRGPLIGLTEQELLDITAALPAPEGKTTPLVFSLRTNAEHVAHPVARQALLLLQELQRKSRVTTPGAILMEAVERLNIRALVAARESDDSGRAAANIESFIERARPYSVRGLDRFVRDVSKEWQTGLRLPEGTVDAEGDAIRIITIHSAKGLEWPVVIPINTCSWLERKASYIHRPSDDSLHWVIDDVASPELEVARELDEGERSLERDRLWYVACTRARELLVIPELTKAHDRSWAHVINLATEAMPPFESGDYSPLSPASVETHGNKQSSDLFAAERDRIAAVSTPRRWLRPSEHDEDRAPAIDALVLEASDDVEADLPIGAGRVRGLVLHKLIEEILTGEVTEEEGALRIRVETLLARLAPETTTKDICARAQEMAETVLKTLGLPEIAALRPYLVSECPVYAELDPTTAVAGRIDAIAYERGAAPTVIDWKSDVSPSETDIRRHAIQLGDYCKIVGAQRGGLVYLTSGAIRWVTPPTAEAGTA